MSIVVTGIADYAPQDPKAIIARTLFGSNIMKLVQEKGNVMTGVKTTDKIILMNTDVVFQAGTGCGWNASGNVTLLDKTLTVGAVKIQETICKDDVTPKYLQLQMKAGSTAFDDVIFQQMIVEKKAESVAQELAIAFWRGDTASGSANLNRFDGFNKIIDAAPDEINGNPTGITTATGIVAANVISIFDGVYNLIPAALLGKDDLIISCGYDTYRLYTVALKNANLFNYIPNGIEPMKLPGTDVTIVPDHGLNGTNRIHAFRLSNVVLGTDLMNEFEEVFFKYDESTMLNRLALYFKMGVQIAYTNEVVTFKLV